MKPKGPSAKHVHRSWTVCCVACARARRDGEPRGTVASRQHIERLWQLVMERSLHFQWVGLRGGRQDVRCL
jgi:hypothetical protein